MSTSNYKNINRNKYQNHPYHLVDPSFWPILVSFSLLCLAIGAVMSMHGYSGGRSMFTMGTLLVGLGMLLWFKDIITEGTFLGNHTREVQKGIITGMLLFIVSEVFAFLSIFWAFFHSSLSPAIEIGGVWPPQGIIALDPFGIPLLNTILLLSSGAFITHAHYSLIKGNRKESIKANLITIIIAAIFTGLQYFEYLNAPFTISDSVFGSAFYCSTGLHGIHVLIGTLFILVQFIRILFFQLTKQHHIGYESSILYWHFVDVVWLFLFVAIYYWGGAVVG